MVCEVCNGKLPPDAYHATRYCSACSRELKRQRDRDYCARNRERARARAKEWYWNNRDRSLDASRRRRTEDPAVESERNAARYLKEGERIRATARAWYARNKEIVLARASSDEGRAKSRARMKERRERDITYRLHVNVSRAVRETLKNKHRRSWETLLGYTAEQLRSHLERQFLPGMIWDNYGRGPGKWHIDHIVPLSAFKFCSTDDQDFRACWAITNLRPLWGADNIAKHANRIFLI